MGCKWYLAMTARELESFQGPQGVAWMACRFSSQGPGLTELPRHLPPESLLLLDDREPIQGHDPKQVIAQLLQLCKTLSPAGLILDLQRPRTPQAVRMAAAIVRALPCPVALTETYAREHSCPVLVSAAMHQPLKQQLAPWTGRQIWLDLPLGQQTLTLTKAGKQIGGISFPAQGDFPHWDKFLSCRYRTQPTPQGQQFTLCRSERMLPGLLKQAAELGVSKAIGLYQEFCK